MRSIYQCYERDVQENTSNCDQSTYSKTKSPETYDIYWWWIVYGKSSKGLPPLNISKLSKKSQENRD